MYIKMKEIFAVLCLLALSVCTVSCIDEEQFNDDNSGNFEALWKIMDEHYCFFDLKKQSLGVDWQEVHARYAPQVAGANSEQLFEVLTKMLGELRDGHVNLYSAFDIGRNWSWKEDYPVNFDETLYKRYIGTDYRIAAGIYYKILDDNIGYMRIPSFGSQPGNGNIDDILFHFMSCRSLIIDVRENGGGMMTSAEILASRFVNKKTLVGYMQHKTGRGHNDFSKLQEQYIEPSSYIRWQKPVFVLTNRGVFSAANEFVKYMKRCSNAVVIGDRTGGGAGLPFSSELPNGWGVRFSACPMYDADGISTENGIEPDVYCSMKDLDMLHGLDTIIEKARQMSI